jgi:DNA invertase Pin-like site-specific DNA recombinase
MILDGYIRVSQVGGRAGDSFISPRVQREQIEGWVKLNGATLGEVFEELDESGARSDRPLLSTAIERVERGRSGGVVVAKLDRFGRKVVDGLRGIARIEEAGGTFVSVQDGFDIRTATGKLVLQLLLSIGEWELDRVRSNWDIACERAIARGVYICKKGPIGYRRGADGRLRIDPREGPTIREVFERRARGETYGEIADYLNASDLETTNGSPFRPDSVRRIIINSAYRGEAHRGEHRNPNAHEPLVSAELWQKSQSLPRRPGHRIEVSLSGLVRCSACGGLMTAVRGRTPRWPHTVYRCSTERGDCPRPALARADQLEPLVEEFIFRRLGGHTEPERSAAIDKCVQTVQSAQDSLEAYRDAPNLLLRLGADSFEAGLARRQRTLERRLLELERERRLVSGPGIEVDELECEWRTLSYEDRKRAIRTLIDLVVVDRGARPVPERASIYPAGRGPIVTREGIVSPAPGKAAGMRLHALKKWPEARIDAQLRAFLGTRRDWPDYLQFARAGESRLHAQAWEWGGPYYWAHRLGLSVGEGQVDWTDKRTHDALKPFLRHRRKWPTKDEFESAGLLPLHAAIRCHGGNAHWAEHFGLEYRIRANDRWSKERIAREFSRHFHGTDRFPLRREFAALDQEGLYIAMHSHGGISYWSDRLGLELTAGWLKRTGNQTPSF